jgi:PAS domain S-box-containing protein
MSSATDFPLGDPGLALRALLAATPGFVYFMDARGRYGHVSEGGAAILGLTPAQMYGKTWSDIGLPREREAEFAEERARVMSTGEPSQRRVSFELGGTMRHFDLTVSAVYDDERRPVGVVVTSRDVTETFEAEERLRLSEIRYRELANAMPQIVWTARADGTVDYFNDRWYEYTGVERDDRDADQAADHVHPDDVQPARDLWRVAIRDGTPYQTETRYRDRNGDYHWFLCRALPIRGDDGTIVRWYGTSTDIDEQKRNEAELAEDRATAEFLTRANDLFAQSLDYETTLASLASMVVPVIAEWCAVDMIEDGRIRRLAVAHEDPAKIALAYDFQQRFPVTLEDKGGIANIVRTGKIEWIAQITDDMLTAGVANPEQLAILRQLELRSYIGAPIVIRGEVVGVLTLIGGSSRAPFDERDVWMASELTQRAANAIENARLYAAAVDANRVKDEFLATLSHELRTPLTAILGWARILRMGGLDEESLRIAIETIESSATAQSALIDDILDVSRIMAGKFKLELADVDVRDVIHNAVASMRPAAEAKGVAIDVSLPNTPMEVHGDANRLQQIVWNLVSNAVKFTGTAGHVIVRVARSGEEVVISVMDTGRGIPAEFLPHVFERFRQFDSSTTRQFGGLGLGLSIVRHLAELHGGSVSAASAGEGRGATFTVRLPAARTNGAAPEPEEEQDGTAELRRRLTDRRVLVVDDDANARAVLSMMLRQFGVSVGTADSVADAVRSLGESEYDLVLSDIAMPGEDGVALVRRIRAGETGRSDIPVIAVTALADTASLVGAGFDAFLQKPVEPQGLAAAVANSLR